MFYVYMQWHIGFLNHDSNTIFQCFERLLASGEANDPPLAALLAYRVAWLSSAWTCVEVLWVCAFAACCA